MLAKSLAGVAAIIISILPVQVLAKTPAGAPPGSDSIQDTRLVPVHEKICVGTKVGSVVDKTKLFFQLLQNASPAVSDQLKFALQGDWHKLVNDKNICPQFKGCLPSDVNAVDSIQTNYAIFVKNSGPYYRASRPDMTPSQYFQNMDDTVDAIDCTARDEQPATPTPSPLDVSSPIRIRGKSDDLSIAQSDGAFAKSSSASANYVGNETIPRNATTTITAAVGYDINVGSLQDVIPFIATNESLAETHKKPRVNSPTNFVSGGILYNAEIDSPLALNQITVKPQQVDGTTMRSELTSMQIVYAPWTDSTALLPALNSVNYYAATDVLPTVTTQLLFDLRSDLGYYEDRGDPAYIAQNRDYARFGSKFGYAITVTPSVFPSYALSVTETALYGVTGAYHTPRDLSYFDALMQIYFDPKKYFSTSLEYINGRDENTYVITHQYKAGLAAHF
jgi:hypothetical protein